MLKSASNFTDKHIQDLSVSMYNSATMLHVSHFIAEKYLLFFLIYLVCFVSSLLRYTIFTAWLSKVLFVSFTANPICFISIETGCG